MARTSEKERFDADAFLRSLTKRPGVYRMLDAKGEVLYVGKASNLRNRVTSYFRGQADTPKVAALRRHVARIEVTVTGSEAEALILEYNLIKRHRPRFNVTLRDDKSFPYVHLTSDHDFPRLQFYRGTRKIPGRFFGPFPSAYAVRETLGHLQKLFRLRSCNDHFFANRSRPCLQYQIKRCTAPCVGLIDADDYAEDVAHAVLFLEGRNREVIDDLVRRMEAASRDQAFERAAQYRDQIASLKKVQERQSVSGSRSGDVDVVAAMSEGRVHCVALMFVRSGRNLGTRHYYPRSAAQVSEEEVLGAFLAQYYLSHDAPAEILTTREIGDRLLLEETLSEKMGRRVAIRHRLRGVRAQWVGLARTNAEQALRMRLASSASIAVQREGLRDALEQDETPQRIECFDVSHTSGESTVASCVVFGPEGAVKSDYRRFNIRGLAEGDDYGAMRQALTRRYTRIKRGEAPLPDLLLVDGGKGQLSQAVSVLEELQMQGLTVLAVAKGAARRPGKERLFLSGRKRPIILPADSPALLLIQQIRDEAHRFAITGHRQRRASTRRTSVLETIPGLGPKRRRELLRQFGGLQGVTRASADELMQTPGISRKLAGLVYETLHTEE